MFPKEISSVFPHLCWTEIVKDRIEAFRETQEKILDHSKPIVDHSVILCIGTWLNCPKVVNCEQIFCNLFLYLKISQWLLFKILGLQKAFSSWLQYSAQPIYFYLWKASNQSGKTSQSGPVATSLVFLLSASSALFQSIDCAVCVIWRWQQ